MGVIYYSSEKISNLKQAAIEYHQVVERIKAVSEAISDSDCENAPILQSLRVSDDCVTAYREETTERVWPIRDELCADTGRWKSRVSPDADLCPGCHTLVVNVIDRKALIKRRGSLRAYFARAGKALMS